MQNHYQIAVQPTTTIIERPSADFGTIVPTITPRSASFEIVCDAGINPVDMDDRQLEIFHKDFEETRERLYSEYDDFLIESGLRACSQPVPDYGFDDEEDNWDHSLDNMYK